MLVDLLKDKKIILGSVSPRRQELLKSLGIDFEIRVKDLKEKYPKNLKEKEISEFLAIQKSENLSKTLKSEEILITADTIVVKGDRVLNKPKDRLEAQEMLQFLSGDKHKVITSVCLASKNKQEVFTSETEVHFKILSIEEIDYYIKEYQPFDKAGAYGIQEWIGLIGIEKIKGSYCNVVGLPVVKLYQKLRQFVGL
ncbi:MAG TPA: septum formation protein Maf [Flavobacteriales bacterium]|nr:septum formation protein Maf [Flavobacteriales bacterium]